MVECLLLQELVTDGVEGDGETASEEQDKVDGQLVPEKKNINNNNILFWKVVRFFFV